MGLNYCIGRQTKEDINPFLLNEAPFIFFLNDVLCFQQRINSGVGCPHSDLPALYQAANTKADQLNLPKEGAGDKHISAGKTIVWTLSLFCRWDVGERQTTPQI